MAGWDGCMVSPTLWTWVSVSSGSWWWTGRPGVLQPMGSQWVTEWNWTSILAWRVTWAEDPGWLWSMWSQRVRHDWAHIHLIYLAVGVKWTMGIEKSKDRYSTYLCIRFYFLLSFRDLGDFGDVLPFYSCRSLLTPLIYIRCSFLKLAGFFNTLNLQMKLRPWEIKWFA